MRRAVCPGSFDPVTNGHVDVINRAAGLYDELVVAVLVNPGKAGLFSVDERMELLRDAVADLPNVVVDSFQGLLVDYCRAHDIPVIVKGLRAVSDFEYELQMAQMNRELAAVETLFVPTAPAGRPPLLQPGQADRQVRRRRLPAGAQGGPRPAAGAHAAGPSRDPAGAHPRHRGRLPPLRDRRRADDGHRERPQRPDVGLLHGAARPPARPARRPPGVPARGRPGRRRDRRAAHRDPPAGPGRGRAAHRRAPARRASSCSATARRQRDELLGTARRQRDELLARAQADAEDLLADAEAEAERLIEEGARRTARRCIAEAVAEHERLITETEVYRGAVARADELGAQTAADVARMRAEVDQYVDSRLADFGTTLERMLRSVGDGPHHPARRP